MRRTSGFLVSGIALVGALAAIAACDEDPVHDNEVTALGPEAPGVPPGPTHRPGQPCLVCHGGSGPATVEFAVAGTIYQAQSGEVVPQNGATITVVDTNGSQATATTNSAGNFWVIESDWTPTFPVHVEAVAYGNVSDSMFTHIGRDGSCATCHSDPPGGDLVGHIFLAPGDEPDGGFPDGGP
jgi:hypothetical protein